MKMINIVEDLNKGIDLKELATKREGDINEQRNGSVQRKNEEDRK